MAVSLIRLGLRSVALNIERTAALISTAAVQNQLKLHADERMKAPDCTRVSVECSEFLCAGWHGSEDYLEIYGGIRILPRIALAARGGGDERPSPETKRFLIHTKPICNGTVCYLPDMAREGELAERNSNSLRRCYSKQHGRPEEDRRKQRSDSDSDSDSDTECKGLDRSEFWRRKMRTVHNILDVDKDGLISFNDFQLFADRFKALGHLDEAQAKEFTEIIQMTWEEQWGAIDPYNYVTVEQYLEDMHHVLNDKSLKKRAHRWLPYLFKAVDKDKSGFISVKEFKLFFKCLGLNSEHAAVAFAVIDTNGDGKLSMKEFVKLGKDFFLTEDETKVSKMFWGPLTDV